MIQVYLIAICVMAASPPAYLAIEALARFLEPRLHALTTMLSYSRPSFLPSSWGLSFMKLASVSLLFAGNGLALGIKVGNEVALERRASLIASINLIILLLGGRTNPLVDSAQISLQTYQLLHRCIGIITVAEASLHSGIFLSRHEPLEALEISGLLALIGLILILPTSLLFLWKPWRHSGKAHLLLYLLAVTGWTWHAFLLKLSLPKVLVLIACGLWGTTHIYRLFSLFVLRHGHAMVASRKTVDGQTTLKVVTNHPIRVYPGCYFYIFFDSPLSKCNYLHGFPIMLLWSDPDEFRDGRTRNLTFLFSRDGHHVDSLPYAEEGCVLRLEGPYGRDPRLQAYENVVLAAKGIGITGVLPFALHFAVRRAWDDSVRDAEHREVDSNDPTFRDITRTVALFWWLDDENQENWVKDQLRALESMQDTEAAALSVLCIYPSERVAEKSDPLFKPGNLNFRVVTNGADYTSFSKELRQEARYPGRTVVLANGDQTFMDAMRRVVLENCRLNRVVSFKEIEYSPGTDKTPRIRKLETPPNLSARVLSGGRVSDVMDEDLERQGRGVKLDRMTELYPVAKLSKRQRQESRM